MQVEINNGRQIVIRRFQTTDIDHLCEYLYGLSSDTKKRFGPHPFDRHAITELYALNSHVGYIAHPIDSSDIIAYAVIKIGFLEHDAFRLESYGMALDAYTDCTFAPSVADLWQGFGIGNQLFRFICADVATRQINRIILWGGVQVDNEKAVHYYLKNGFTIHGQFTYNGENYDMSCMISG